MMPTKALVTALVVASVVGLALLIERQAEAPGYTFPPGASVPWHIHPDAHEFDYQLDGALLLQTDGQPSKALKRGDAVYVAPNVVHRGVNVSRTQAAKIFVVRVKPKDKPLTTEVQP